MKKYIYIAAFAVLPLFVSAQKAKDQIALLANNLGRLNNVYGNMLSAMQGRS